MVATVIMGSRAIAPVRLARRGRARSSSTSGIAVVAGQLLSRLPHTALEVVVTVLFAGGAAYLLFVPEREEAASAASARRSASVARAERARPCVARRRSA